MTFDEAMVLTRTVSSSTAFEDDECRAYFDVLMSLPPDSLIVEVGLEYGRSSSIALQVAKEHGLRYWGIDSFSDEVASKWLDMALPFANPPRFKLWRQPSNDFMITEPIAAILIDGDHTYEGVMADCEHFLPHVMQGGYAMFHDYARESLPGVTQAVQEYWLAHSVEWMPEVMRSTGTLGIWRRL